MHVVVTGSQQGASEFVVTNETDLVIRIHPYTETQRDDGRCLDKDVLKPHVKLIGVIQRQSFHT